MALMGKNRHKPGVLPEKTSNSTDAISTKGEEMPRHQIMSLILKILFTKEWKEYTLIHLSQF